MPSSSFESQNTHLQALLQSARPLLRGQLENIDSNLPKLIAVLKSVGAGECWHKHGSFLDHLIDIYRILKLWHTPDAKLIHDDLLFKYDDITELIYHVKESGEKVGSNEEWRVKIRSVLPHDGIVMKHIKTGEDVCLSRRVVAVKNALWPGDGKRGLWMSSLSRMGAIYRLIAREEELCLIERGQGRVEGVNTEFLFFIR
ncbi:hypothetical protein Tco_1114855 [Tanacetum coccineum]